MQHAVTMQCHKLTLSHTMKLKSPSLAPAQIHQSGCLRRRIVGSTVLATILLLFAAAPPAWAQASGSLDALDAKLEGNYVDAIALQADGKVIIAGEMTVPRVCIARLNPDWSLDRTFDFKTNGTVIAVKVQADGKILFGGFFTTFQPNGTASPIERNYVARLNADGSLDTGFNPKASGAVHSIVVQPDGKILLGGEFTTLQPNGDKSPTLRNKIARLNADGSLDAGFDPNVGYVKVGSDFTGNVRCMALQSDGKILLAGGFTTLQPNGAATATARSSIARVNADGSVDVNFDPKPNSGPIYTLAVQSDGKILVGGRFSSLQPSAATSPTKRGNIARLNADGTLDADFDPNPNDFVRCIAIQADGKILLGGAFTSLQPNGAPSATARQYVARINPDGSLDTHFDPKADSHVTSVALQDNGKILLGGMFSALQPNGAASAVKRKLLGRLSK